MSGADLELLRLQPWSSEQVRALVPQKRPHTHVVLTFGAADAVRISMGGSPPYSSEDEGAAQVLRRVALREPKRRGTALSLAEFWDPSWVRTHPVIAVTSCRVAATAALSMQLRGERPGPVGYGGSAALIGRVVDEVTRDLNALQLSAEGPDGAFLFGAYASEDPQIITVLVRGRSLPATLRATHAVHRVAAPAAQLHPLARVLTGAPATGPEAIFDASSSLIGMELTSFTGPPDAWILPQRGAASTGATIGLIQGIDPHATLGESIQLHADLHVRNGAAAAGIASFQAMLDADQLIAAGGNAPQPRVALRYPLGVASARSTQTIHGGTTHTLAQLLLSRVTSPEGSAPRRSGASVSTVLSASWATAVGDEGASAGHQLGDPLRAQLDHALDVLHSRLKRRAPEADGRSERAGWSARLDSAMAALRREPAEFTMLAALIELYGVAQAAGRSQELMAELDRVLEMIQSLHPLRPRDPVEAWVGATPLEAPSLRRSIERLASAVRLWSQRFPADGQWGPAPGAPREAERAAWGGGPTALVLRATAPGPGTIHARALSTELFVFELPHRKDELEPEDLFLAPAYAEAWLSLLRWPLLWGTHPRWHQPIEDLALLGRRTLRPHEDLRAAFDRIGHGISARAEPGKGVDSMRLLGAVLSRTVVLLLGLLIVVDEASAAQVDDPHGAACALAAKLIAAETARPGKPANQTMRGALLVLLICECAVDLRRPATREGRTAPPAAGQPFTEDAQIQADVAARVDRFMTLVEALRIRLAVRGGVHAAAGADEPDGLAGATARIDTLCTRMGAAPMPWAVAMLTLLTDLGEPAVPLENARLLRAVIAQLLHVVWRLDDDRRSGACPADEPQRFPNGAAALRALTRAIVGQGQESLDAVLDVGYDTGISALERLIRRPRAGRAGD